MAAATRRLYLDDDHCARTSALVVGVSADAIAFDQSCFYPGGGGQPADHGTVNIGGETFRVIGIRADAETGILWHLVEPAPCGDLVGQLAHLAIDVARRDALTRYHTVLHVLNTITQRDYNGWITGAQMQTDYARIDFNLSTLSAELCADLEAKVNAVLEQAHPLRAFYLPEEEFRARPDLLRTLEAKPPVVDGRVRVVEITGFDAQACGGTHVDSTAHVGRFSIFKTENKGKLNKRLYIRLQFPHG